MSINMDEYEKIPDLDFSDVDCIRYRHKITGCEMSISGTEKAMKDMNVAPIIRMKRQDWIDNHGT